MRHNHFDEARIAAVCDQHAVELATLIDKPGPIAVQARMSIAAAKAIHLAVIREINRGVEVDQIIMGACSLLANAIRTIASGTEGEEEDHAVVRFSIDTFTDFVTQPEDKSIGPATVRVMGERGGTA